MKQQLPEVETTRYKYLPNYLKVILLVFGAAGIVLSVLHTFNVAIRGEVMLTIAHYYFTFALFASISFLVIPARKTDKHVQWYDLVAFGVTFAIGLYFFFNALEIMQVGWMPASRFNFTLGLIFCLLILEMGRRMGGRSYFAVCLILGGYPLYAGFLPGLLWSPSLSIRELISFQSFSTSGMLGVPANVIGLVFGFLVFAGVLVASGGGLFFLNLALGLMGGFRGGAAKVSVVSSGLFGSLSGSIISNVVADGPITIPTMMRTGYEPHFAAAVEACASTGGVIMPPVMGSLAFVMCVFLGVDYSVVVIAAALPAFLYYFGLYMQIDAHAAKIGLKGLPREELPSLKQTFKTGWPFLFVLVFLTWGLIFMQWSVKAPFYASALMILLSYTNKEIMLTPKKLLNVLVLITNLIVQTVAVILPIGFIVCGLTVTGTMASLTSALISLGGHSVFLLLLIGAVVLYILGMAGLCTPAYVFMAVTLAPAILKITDMNQIALHLFIVYYANLASITPPVALAAFVAAAIVGADPMKTGLQAMRLGICLYFVPFFFVFNPSLILEGSYVESAYLFVRCIVGIIIIAGGVEGYLLRIGALKWYERVLALVGGALIGFPSWTTFFIGVVITLVLLAAILWRKRFDRQKSLSTQSG